MLKIRLQRVGRKNHAEFRVVVCEHTTGPKSANNIEIIGAYNPHQNTVSIDADRAKHWIGVGAQVSDTVHNLMVKEGILEGKKRNVLPRKSPIVDESAAAKEEEPAAEAEVTEEEKPAEETAAA